MFIHLLRLTLHRLPINGSFLEYRKNSRFWATISTFSSDVQSLKDMILRCPMLIRKFFSCLQSFSFRISSEKNWESRFSSHLSVIDTPSNFKILRDLQELRLMISKCSLIVSPEYEKDSRHAALSTWIVSSPIQFLNLAVLSLALQTVMEIPTLLEQSVMLNTSITGQLSTKFVKSNCKPLNVRKKFNWQIAHMTSYEVQKQISDLVLYREVYHPLNYDSNIMLPMVETSPKSEPP